ncbi:MAG: sacsin N-terminal ATP-binding-like domain-containing protein [Gammaproteobacteria bacterium]
MATPEEIIQRIRRKEFLIDVEMSPEVEEGARNMRVNLNNALKTLSEDLYTKDTHFVLELVQNADDNEYAHGVEPEISFQLSPACLVVQNNEVGFNESNVVALCRVGQTTKVKREGFIGEKGIGFKSVFTATDRPEIHSNGFHFRFDCTDPTHVLGYVVPHWCGDNGYPQGRTTIVLPAKEGTQFTAEKLEELTDELILFLRKLRNITIVDDTAGTKRFYKGRDNTGTVTLTAEAFEPGSDVPKILSQRKFKYVRHTYSTTNIKEDKRQDVEEAAVVLAFPITDAGAASADLTQNLFAFLPVRNYGFRFLVQGDFLLISSRGEVHKNPLWNKRARDEVVQAFVSALSVFKRDPVLSCSFLHFVPRKGDISDAFFAEAAEKLIEELKNTECMLSASGAWRKPKEVIIADEDFKALFSNDELKRILGLEYLSSEVQAPPATLERLGVFDAGVLNHLFTLIEKDNHLPDRPIDWLRALYRYCEKKVTGGQAILKFKFLAATKLDGGGFTRLANTKVYFPLERGRRYGFEHELQLLHPDLFLGEGAEDVTKFLSRVGVGKSEPYSLIVNHILPKHASGDGTKSGISALVGHVVYIKEHLPHYLKGAVDAGETQENAVAKLRSGLYLQSKKIEDSKTYFARPFEMYLGSEYRPTIPLEGLLGRASDPVKFIAGVYLAPLSREADDEETEKRKGWKDFFNQIGVNPYPAVEAIPGSSTDYRASPELSALLTSEDVKIRKRAIETVDRHWAYYSGYLEARSAPRRGYTTTSASQFLQFLQGVKAPSRKRGEFKLAETYLDVDYVRAVFGGSAAYLDAEVSNSDFLDAVNVTHRVDAAACIKRLDQLRRAERVSNRDVKLIYRELERLFDKEKTLINGAFNEAPRIYVPELGRWFKVDDVVWESSGAFMDAQLPPLGIAYQEHQTFFWRYLHVPRQPKESALIQALTKLDEYGETHAERKSEALTIYRRLARSFRDEQARDANTEPDWLESLRTKAVFLDHMDQLVDVSNDIYIGDEPRLADAFKAHERISLLAVDPLQVPQLQDLLTQCGMQKLSAVAKYGLTAAEGAALDVEVTRRIRQRSNHLMRVFYVRAYSAFERANNQGLWKSLKSLEVRTVAALEVEAEVSGYRVRVSTDIYRQGQVIYLQAGTRGKFDKIAQELCIYLGARPDVLSESIYRVLDAAGDDELQDFFEAKRVPDIPHDVLASLLKAEQQSPETEPVQEHSAEERQDTQEDVTPAEPVAIADESRPQESTPDPSPVSPDGKRSIQPPARPTSESRSTGTSPQGESGTAPAPRRREPERKSSGRLLSYAEPASRSEREPASDTSHEENLSIAKAAVDFVIGLERKDGHEVIEMPFNNEGFDIRRGLEGAEEYIEVKGLRGAWGAEGVPLTPPELRMAERQREHFWLYVVEYATDPSRRCLYKIQDPFGNTNQFRFDSGWKSVVSGGAVVIDPAEGRRVSIEGLGAGTILSVTEAGVLRRLRIRLDTGQELTRIYDPTKMSVFDPA